MQGAGLGIIGGWPRFVTLFMDDDKTRAYLRRARETISRDPEALGEADVQQTTLWHETRRNQARRTRYVQLAFCDTRLR
jgi:hypothetical protein